ncbi:ATP-dependent helicase/deoxyribonuclease subunit B [Rhynchospora pubera]|uniref:ATP-dependent helicase/deoxyribonuclease subunit B n=1 Tax=Rhynchospora pubera TaxID=906938 RepID=A0AAV8ELS6_9POAL|nr:ATP-dependent helicase/deoxyribonuclease subunit B [Rhynchospora pubera]
MARNRNSSHFTATLPIRFVFLVWISSLPSISLAYRPGEIVPMSRSGQYHGSRTVWHDVVGRHCPVFAVNKEVLMPITKPVGFTGADPYKLSFQIGHEKLYVPWLYVINRKSPEVPMIDFHLKYSGNDIHGVTAKVIDMPHHYVQVHQDIKKNYWNPQQWPKHIIVRYTWEETSEIDVAGGFYVLFGSGLLLSFMLAIYVLQSSKDKLEKFVRETVAETNPEGVAAKAE